MWVCWWDKSKRCKLRWCDHQCLSAWWCNKDPLSPPLLCSFHPGMWQSLLFHLSDPTHGRKQPKEGVTLGQCQSRVHQGEETMMIGKILHPWWQKFEATGPVPCALRQLTFSFSLVPEPQALGWCDPHSGWVFPPQLNLYGNTLTQTHPEGHFLGDSKSQQVENEGETPQLLHYFFGLVTSFWTLGWAHFTLNTGSESCSEWWTGQFSTSGELSKECLLSNPQHLGQQMAHSTYLLHFFLMKHWTSSGLSTY